MNNTPTGDADGIEQSDEQVVAAMVAHDARVMAGAHGAVVHTDVASFLRAIEAGRARQERRAADPRTTDQIRSDIGALLQRFYEARWYGTAEDVRRTGESLGQTLREWAHDISTPAEAVVLGDYIRAVGRDPVSGEPASASGVVEEATYTTRDEPGRRTGVQYGVHFVISPPQRDDGHALSYDVFVDEGTRLIKLPAPVDRGRPAWLDHHGPRGGAQTFPPPDRIDPTAAAVTRPLPSTDSARHRRR